MKKSNFYFKKNILCTCMLFAFVVTPVAWAGATFDGTTDSGTTASLSGNFTVTEADGSLRGTNLFHSFSDFNINAGESATFTGTSPINNVVSRVTGSNSTTINGQLTSTITGANFYFINPNGIVFKEGAAIDVKGSFYASTSDFIRLSQDGIFYADAASGSVMTISPPTSFGFLDSNVGQITLQGAQLIEGINLGLPDGATFSLIGGNISIEQATAGSATLLGGFGVPNSTGSFIALQGNRFDIVSVASAGEVVPVNSGGYDLTSFNTLGNVTLTGGSIIDSNNIYIRGGNVDITDAVIAPGYMNLLFGLPQGNAGTIDIAATDQFNITGTEKIQTFFAPYLARPGGGSFLVGITTFGGVTVPDTATINISGGSISLTGTAEIKSTLLGSGTAGDINISGGNVSLSDTAAIRSTLQGSGTAGDININGNNISLTGASVIRGLRTNSGTAGNINITGNLLEVLDGSLISNFNTYAGTGGNITINANQVILDGQNSTGITGILTSSDFNVSLRTTYDPAFAHADSGNIIINATGIGGLTVKNGAFISTESRSFGNAGDINIAASDINLSRDGKSVGSIASQSVYAGDAGDITLNATNDIDISGGFEISATTAGMGTGGDISITAGNNINISGENSGIASAAPEPVDAVKNYLGYVMIGSNSFANLLGAFGLPANSTMYDALGFLQAVFGYPVGLPVAGDAGSITLAASTLNMNNNSRITTSTSSDGNGGSLNITVDKLAMKNGAEIRSRSGLYNNGVLEVGAGNGGDINITASKSVSMKSGSSISASSLGTGLAGDVFLNAGKILDLNNSSITTQATIADGGNITIRATDMIYLDQSNITTSVENGVGNGGNIDIDPEFFIIESSNILANAYGGSGGNINIVANNLLSTPDSVIDASSTLGVDGTVNFSSPDEDVSDDLAVLPDNYLDVTSLISERCGSTGSSSLVNAGPAGMTVDPDGYLPSFAVASNHNNINTTNTSTNKDNHKHWSKSYIDKSEINLTQLACNTL